MIYRGRGFLALRIIWLLHHPLLLPLVCKLGQRHTERPRRRDNLLMEGGGSWKGAKSCDGEKAWSSTNHLILSGRHSSSSLRDGSWQTENRGHRIASKAPGFRENRGRGGDPENIVIMRTQHSTTYEGHIWIFLFAFSLNSLRARAFFKGTIA
jgi:hypothetical protein